jgi:hypothetical protein
VSRTLLMPYHSYSFLNSFANVKLNFNKFRT